MVRIERNPLFWCDVIAHPSVAEGLGGAVDPERLAVALESPSVVPLASERGGFLFSYLDALQRVMEMHTAYVPSAWFPSREIPVALAEALNHVFAGPCQMVVTYQLESNPRSQPPRSFGFQPVGGFEPSILGSLKTWMLSRDAWFASKVGRRSCH